MSTWSIEVPILPPSHKEAEVKGGGVRSLFSVLRMLDSCYGATTENRIRGGLVPCYVSWERS